MHPSPIAFIFRDFIANRHGHPYDVMIVKKTTKIFSWRLFFCFAAFVLIAIQWLMLFLMCTQCGIDAVLRCAVHSQCRRRERKNAPFMCVSLTAHKTAFHIFSSRFIYLFLRLINSIFIFRVNAALRTFAVFFSLTKRLSATDTTKTTCTIWFRCFFSSFLLRFAPSQRVKMDQFKVYYRTMITNYCKHRKRISHASWVFRVSFWWKTIGEKPKTKRKIFDFWVKGSKSFDFIAAALTNGSHA